MNRQENRTWVIAGMMLIALSIIVCSLGCGDDDNPVKPPTGVSIENGLDSLIVAAGVPSAPPEYADTTRSTPVQIVQDGVVWSCRDVHYSIAKAFQDYPNFNPNAEWLFPGEMLQGASITSPTPDRVPVDRGPGEVVITNITGAEVSSIEVPAVSIGSVLDAANQIIRSQPASFPANLAISIDQVRAQSQLEILLKANASFLGLFDVSSQLQLTSGDEYSSYLVRLNQSFYTLVFDRPASPSRFFADGVTMDDVAPYLGPGNPPVYCSSVTYGRYFYLLIESTEDRDTVESSVQGSFLGLAGGSGSFKHVSELRGLKVKAFALGGDASEAILAVRDGLDGLNGFLDRLARGGLITTAIPLTYVLRTLATDEVVKNGVATDYELRDCRLVAEVDPIEWTTFSIGNEQTKTLSPPTIAHASKTITFVDGLSYRPAHDDDYRFGISTSEGRYTIQAHGGNSSSRLTGRIVTWSLPEYVKVQRSYLEVLGGSNSQSSSYSIPSGYRGFAVVELMKYDCKGDDDMNYWLDFGSNRVTAHTSGAGSDVSVRFRVTILSWPSTYAPTKRSQTMLAVGGGGTESLSTRCGRTLVTPSAYRTSGDDDLYYVSNVSDCRVELMCGDAGSSSQTELTVWEIDF